MSTTLGVINVRPAAGITVRPNQPQHLKASPKVAVSPGPPRSEEVRDILSRSIRPKEMREFHPSKPHEFTFPDVSAQRPEPLDPPDPAKVEARSYSLTDPRRLTRQEPRDLNLSEIRSFSFPAPDTPKPKEVKDLSVDRLQGAEVSPLNPGELKPSLRFEDVFFRPREFQRHEPFDPVEVEPVDPMPPGGAGLRAMNLPGPDTYRQVPKVMEINPRLAEAYRDGDKVIQQYSHDPMSHWHYHYVPVPADDIPPPRNRNIVLPRIGGVLDRTT